jgi:predicted transcriptional regulator
VFQNVIHMQRSAVPSQKAEEMVTCMAELLRSRRDSLNASLGSLSVISDLDRAALKRAESGERVPSLGFWIDWADSLGTSLEEVLDEARMKVQKKAGEPPERRRLGQ